MPWKKEYPALRAKNRYPLRRCYVITPCGDEKMNE
jgi:hypothetical protein